MSSRTRHRAIAAATAALLSLAPSPVRAASGEAARIARTIRDAILATGSQGGVAAPAASPTAKGVAVLPDGKRFLVNKTLGSERWVLTWDTRLSARGDISGNVLTDSAVVFLSCPVTRVTSSDVYTADFVVSCSSGVGIVPQGGWGYLGEYTIPARFFLP